MEPAMMFDAAAYHQFPNFKEMENDYIRFISSLKQEVTSSTAPFPIANEIQKARETIKSSIDTTDVRGNLNAKFTHLESIIKSLAQRVESLEGIIDRLNDMRVSPSEAKAVVPNAKKTIADEDDVDLFASDDDDDDAERERIKNERVAAYNAKKANEVKQAAKSTIILDVKPWDDTTDMKEMERLVRTIETDGLVWGTSKLVPVVAKIHKLQITCVVEDDKVGTDFLEDSICAFEDYVQSVDVAAFNKL